jgi:hypothetical protein
MVIERMPYVKNILVACSTILDLVSIVKTLFVLNVYGININHANASLFCHRSNLNSSNN